MARDMRITLAFKRIFTLRHTGYVRVDLSIRVILVGEDRKPQVTEFKQDESPHCPSSLSSYDHWSLGLPSFSCSFSHRPRLQSGYLCSSCPVCIPANWKESRQGTLML